MSASDSPFSPIHMSPDLPSARLRPLFTLELNISAVLRVGSAAAGLVIGVVGGGSFEGRVSGNVLAGGADWQRIQPDGSLRLDCRIILETSMKQLVAMTYRGIRAGTPDVLARLASGQAVTADEYYLRVQASFETGASELAWLNRIVCVGTGMRHPTGPIYNLFELL